LAADALGAGVSLLAVTLGPRGVVYVAAPGFEKLADKPGGHSSNHATAVRSALIKGPVVETLDPTGCGDVFGAAAFARLLAGDSVETALRHAAQLAARNAGFRGASGLSRYLRGELVTP
jgi:sugar/nucleoside kinase (ribokinase family)